MDAQETTARLIQGSHNIDRMQENVKRVVSMVVGCILSYCFRKGLPTAKACRTVATPNGRWVISRVDDIHHDLRVRCWLFFKNRPAEILAFDSRGKAEDEDVDAQTVLSLYQSLPIFVGDMIHIHALPGLQDELQPLIDASYVTFPDQSDHG